MHTRVSLLSLEQRRQKQLLCLMYIHKHRFNVARVDGHLTRADQVFTFARERYSLYNFFVNFNVYNSIIFEISVW